MTYRGSYRGAYSALVEDQDFQRLSPPARHVLLTLRLSPQNNAASMFRIYPDILASQTGYVAIDLDAALAELQCSPSPARPWVFLDGPVLWIRNGLRFDPNINLSNANHRIAVLRALAGLPKTRLLARFCKYYRLPMATARVQADYRVLLPPSRRRRKNKEFESPLPPSAPDDGAARPPNPGAESEPSVLDHQHQSSGRGSRSGQAVHIASVVNGVMPRPPIGRYGEILRQIQSERPEIPLGEQESMALAEFDRQAKGAPR